MSLGWRPDIQALRAVAVLAVVLFHLDLLPHGRGYLGVDVFFVISGYLIGGKLEDAAVEGRLRLRSFWARRVVRLWPAASVTLLVTWLACAFLLDRYEMRLFLEQVAGAATLTANMVLWRQVDYFGSGAAIKPLLHVWSLAVEEQFYLLLPFVFLPGSRRRPAGQLALVLVVVGSFALWLYARQHAPSAAFYGLPTRVWELGAGVLAALGERRQPALARGILRAGPWLGPVAVAGMMALMLAGNELASEAWAMVIAVVATACLLLVQGNHGIRPPVWLTAIGDRSYALYLVHWPIIALAHNVMLGDLSSGVIALLAGLIVLATELLYRGVDRRPRPTAHWARWLAVHGAIALVAGAILGWAAWKPADDGFRQASEGLSIACNKSALFDPVRACRSAASADVLLWGDSFAMQLVPGLISGPGRGIVQATHVTCGPLLGVAPTNDSNPPGWAQGCIDWNLSVLAGLRHMPQVKTVVLASILSQYVAGAEPGWHLYLRNGASGTGRVAAQDDRLVAAALLRTIAAIRATGRRVILYRPQPYGDVDIGRCLARRREHLLVFGAPQDCSFPPDGIASARVRAFLLSMPAGIRVPMIDPAPLLCEQSLCRPMRDGQPLYADKVHLSPAGSIWLAHRLNLAARIDHDAK